jgi:hypothetical protein
MIVSQYDIYVKEAILDTLSLSALEFAVQSGFVDTHFNTAENCAIQVRWVLILYV